MLQSECIKTANAVQLGQSGWSMKKRFLRGERQLKIKIIISSQPQPYMKRQRATCDEKEIKSARITQGIGRNSFNLYHNENEGSPFSKKDSFNKWSDQRDIKELYAITKKALESRRQRSAKDKTTSVSLTILESLQPVWMTVSAWTQPLRPMRLPADLCSHSTSPLPILVSCVTFVMLGATHALLEQAAGSHKLRPSVQQRHLPVAVELIVPTR